MVDGNKDGCSTHHAVDHAQQQQQCAHRSPCRCSARWVAGEVERQPSIFLQHAVPASASASLKPSEGARSACSSQSASQFSLASQPAAMALRDLVIKLGVDRERTTRRT